MPDFLPTPFSPFFDWKARNAISEDIWPEGDFGKATDWKCTIKCQTHYKLAWIQDFRFMGEFLFFFKMIFLWKYFNNCRKNIFSQLLY